MHPTAYLYDINDNKFYEIDSPLYPVSRMGIVELNDGRVLLAGGMYKEAKNKIAKPINLIQVLKFIDK